MNETSSNEAISVLSVKTPALPHPIQGWYERSPIIIAGIVLLIVILIVFGGSLNYDMLWYDSEKYILEDVAIQKISWNNIYQVLTTNYFANYNPLHRLSYMLEYPLWGSSPAGYRVTNWMLHWIGASCCFVFFLRLTQNHVTAWFLAICFAVHPTRVESVVWLAQRKDVLAAAFGFAALCCYHQFGDETSVSKRRIWYLATCLLYVGAVASKAQWVPLCSILVCMDWYLQPGSIRSQWVKYLLFIGLSAVFSWWAYQAQILELNYSSSSSLGYWVNAPFRDVAIYFRLIFWPIGLYTRTPTDLNFQTVPLPIVGWQVVAGLGILIGLGVLAWKWSSKRREIFFGVSWFLLFLSPMLNLVPGELIPTDRYLYIAILGPLFPIGCWLGEQSFRWQLISLVGTCLILGSLTLNYLPTWKDNYTLWNQTVLHNPTSTFAIHNLLVDAQRRHEKQEEYFLLELLVKLEPGNSAYQNAAGITAYNLGDYPKAAIYLGMVSQNAPGLQNDALNCFRLGHSLLIIHQPAQALGFLEQAIKLEPKTPQYWYTLGEAHKTLGHLDQALRCYRKALEFNASLSEKVQPKINALEAELNRASQKGSSSNP